MTNNKKHIFKLSLPFKLISNKISLYYSKLAKLSPQELENKYNIISKYINNINDENYTNSYDLLYDLYHYHTLYYATLYELHYMNSLYLTITFLSLTEFNKLYHYDTTPIGSGVDANVYKIYNSNMIIKILDLEEERVLSKIVYNINLYFNHINHIPNNHFIKLYKVYVIDNFKVAYIMNYIDGITIYDYLHKKKYKSIPNEINLKINTLLEILHKHNIIHDDLHLNNILINPTTTDVFIIDFDHAKYSPDYLTHNQMVLNKYPFYSSKIYIYYETIIYYVLIQLLLNLHKINNDKFNINNISNQLTRDTTTKKKTWTTSKKNKKSLSKKIKKISIKKIKKKISK